MVWIESTSVRWDHGDLGAWLRQPLPAPNLKWVREDQDAFDVRFLEEVLARAGEDVDVLAQLGHLYTQGGRHRDGLAVDRRLVALKPRDPIAHYNYACSLALLKQTSRAFAALKKAVVLGYRDLAHLEQDRDLENLRGDPRWGEVRSALAAHARPAARRCK